MKLSIIELGTVSPGSSGSDALAQSIETARQADRLGFHRVWFAEHHASHSGASQHPELLIAAAGMVTRGIRLGSGAVLMNHYSPFKVAEMFHQLEGMFPGRIDLGMGRSTAGPVHDIALKRDRRLNAVDDHGQQVSEVVAWLHNAFPQGHPFANHPLVPTLLTRPESWLLASSPHTAMMAAELGIGFAFAGFINPQIAASTLRTYRENFQPTPFGSGEPRAMLSMHVSVGETTEEGKRQSWTARAFFQRLNRTGLGATIPTVKEAESELSEGLRNDPVRIVDGLWPRFVAGDPEDVKETLDAMIQESQADELMIQNLIADPEDRRRSQALLASAYDLSLRY